MTRLTIKRPSSGVVIGSIVVNGTAHLYDSKIATPTELADMQRAKNDLNATPNHPQPITRWLRGKGYTVEVR